MRRKPLPAPPDDLEAVREAQAAVPLVPGTEEDCCARLQGRLELPGRDTAATWLDFLRGLGLAEEGPAGFSRVRTDADDAALAETFIETVYGAREVHETLAGADAPVDAETVAARTRELVTPWERQRDGPDWETVWRERTEDLLDWLVLLGLAERADGSYRAASTD
jgi:hypothetical protein